jgi:hypothetical protein
MVRYYFQKGRVKAAIENDAEVEKAMEILAQPELYLSTLNTPAAQYHARIKASME